MAASTSPAERLQRGQEGLQRHLHERETSLERYKAKLRASNVPTGVQRAIEKVVRNVSSSVQKGKRISNDEFQSEAAKSLFGKDLQLSTGEQNYILNYLQLMSTLKSIDEETKQYEQSVSTTRQNSTQYPDELHSQIEAHLASQHRNLAALEATATAFSIQLEQCRADLQGGKLKRAIARLTSPGTQRSPEELESYAEQICDQAFTGRIHLLAASPQR